MTTGIDAITCRLLSLMPISTADYVQTNYWRGTRINEEYNKTYFTILDFRNVTDLFADPDFDGEPIQIKKSGKTRNPTI
jgi:type I restriction enzyme R subunit